MYPGTWAAQLPDKAAVLMAETGACLTYCDLNTRSIRLAHALREHGLRHGDVVAFLMDNSPEVFEVYWAAQRSGLYATAINHHLSAEEIAYIVQDSQASALIVSASLAALVEHVGDASTPALRLAVGGRVARFADYEIALAAMPSEPPADQPRGGDMLYSSGTTGRPKGIKPRLPNRQVDEPGDASIRLFASRYRLDADVVYYSPSPLYHAAPLRFCATVQALGGTVVVSSRFDAEASLAAIQRYDVTHTQWVPTMFVRMLRLPVTVRAAYDLSSMQVAIHAAAPCPADVKRKMIDWWGPILEEYYSSTESNGITFIDSHEWLRKPGSVGRGGVMGQIRICDDTGALVPNGDIGTVYFERNSLPFTYHGDPAKTRRAQHPTHPTWTTSGDIGHVDDDGYLFLADRQDFVIISGGVNIYPQEIESCLMSHPDVWDVAVIGEPDQEMGERVRAIVQPVETAQAGAELAADLIAHVRARIAHFKAPRVVEFTDHLPRTPAGKLAKHLLRASVSDGSAAPDHP